MTTLVVGRGLLGRAVIGSLARRKRAVQTVDVPWEDPGAAVRALRRACERAAATDEAWQLAWTAGAGVIATPEDELTQEVLTFHTLLAGLRDPPSAMFLASSAGGVYAGSPDRAPFSETSAVGALSPYGRAKLAMEGTAAELAERGSRVVLGRIANLYGPGQDLTKNQGLVSQLCVTHLTQQPLQVYAAMDSLRDYIFVRDAAELVVSCLDRAALMESGRVVVKILASGQSRSVGSVIGESTRAFRRRPHIVIRGASSQVMDLRLRSTTWADLDSVAQTPFLVGLRATVDDLSVHMRSGPLA
ncbi:NAD-dependent epimerase/dehydratase family protein [Nocardioides sp.]|uniref:NAD-dependent epimerase/dehydratase family protein n=1 Tax=Nocardioides sp. TaxID=35761 RepID=UPI002BABEDA4|nr:NAD-dependent epimerase/dehydratase family protein [Nocardioides sp.]HXH78011.1 NAD-dependent epimerase/dehydratase family protein [Nocardioides sp.]